jgi:predicted RNA binding protein YcfA (HicA-like mRNA interferase family)
MKIDELIKKLKKDGWYEERQGKHKVFKHPVKKNSIAVPYHKGKEVPTGTCNAILKQAGLK